MTMENLTRFDWNKEISEFTASDIMTQRNKVELINLDWSEDHIKNIIMGFSHHTIPVVKGIYNNFISVVKINELYEALIQNKKPWEDIQKYCHAIDGVFDIDSVDKVYQKLSKRNLELVSVVDQHRDFIGVITQKDIYGLLNKGSLRLAKTRMASRKYGHGKFKWEDRRNCYGDIGQKGDKYAYI